MRFFLIPVLLLLALAACRDETLAAYGASEQVWVLEELDGQAFDARATLSFGSDGKVFGAAPCNRFSGEQTAPYPWFELSPLAVTRMACPDLEAEGAYLQALQSMTQSEISGPVLILSNDDGRRMVFRAKP